MIALQMAQGAVMKRMLVVNDMHGSKVMREAILAEMNGLMRFTDRLITNVQSTQSPAKPDSGDGQRP